MAVTTKGWAMLAFVAAGWPAAHAHAQTSTASWQSFPLPAAESGSLEMEFDATPDGAAIDGVVGLGDGPASAYDDLAAMIRFHNTGLIDARDGDAYVADSSIPFAAATTYHFRLVLRVPTHVYSAYVTPAGGNEETIGRALGFRTPQLQAAQLTHWALIAETGSHTVTNLNVAHSQPIREVVVLHAAATPVVDGELSEFAGAPAVELQNTATGSTASYQLLWTAEALYVGGRFVDATIAAVGADEDAALWSDDGLEMMLDPTLRMGRSLTAGVFKAFAVANGVTSGRSYDPSGRFPVESVVHLNGTLNDASDTDRGFDIEVRIAFADLGTPAPSDGQRWGLDLAANDRDGSRDSVIWSDATPASGYNDPDGWGHAVFSNEAPGPPGDGGPRDGGTADGDGEAFHGAIEAGCQAGSYLDLASGRCVTPKPPSGCAAGGSSASWVGLLLLLRRRRRSTSPGGPYGERPKKARASLRMRCCQL